MRHPSMCPMRSPGPTIARRTPERIGQTTRTSRKSSAKKMRLICRGRISLRPNDLSCEETAPASAGIPGKVFSPERAVSTSLLECGAMPIPVCAHLSRFFWTGQPLTYPAVQNSGAAAEDHELTAPPMHFPQICSVRKRIRLEVTSPAGGIAGYALLTLVYRPRIGVTRRTRVFGARPTQQDISG